MPTRYSPAGAINWAYASKLRFHYYIADGVFGADGEADKALGVVFHAATALDAGAVVDVQSLVRRWILRAFVRRDLIDKGDGEEMGCCEHGSGFYVDAPACIATAITAFRPPPKGAPLALPFTHNYSHPELSNPRTNPLHRICRWA